MAAAWVGQRCDSPWQRTHRRVASEQRSWRARCTSSPASISLSIAAQPAAEAARLRHLRSGRCAPTDALFARLRQPCAGSLARDRADPQSAYPATPRATVGAEGKGMSAMSIMQRLL
jgi:hypothetical protein